MVASAPAHSSPQKALCGPFVFELIPGTASKGKANIRRLWAIQPDKFSKRLAIPSTLVYNSQ